MFISGASKASSNCSKRKSVQYDEAPPPPAVSLIGMRSEIPTPSDVRKGASSNEAAIRLQPQQKTKSLPSFLFSVLLIIIITFFYNKIPDALKGNFIKSFAWAALMNQLSLKGRKKKGTFSVIRICRRRGGGFISEDCDWRTSLKGNKGGEVRAPVFTPRGEPRRGHQATASSSFTPGRLQETETPFRDRVANQTNKQKKKLVTPLFFFFPPGGYAGACILSFPFQSMFPFSRSRSLI